MKSCKRLFPIAALILIAQLGWPGAARGHEGARRVRLDGRWDVVFDLPEGFYETPVEFAVARDGSVRWSVLGQTGTMRIYGESGRLKGNTLTLNARTSFGKFKISAAVDGDGMSGRWRPAGFFTQLFFSGEMRGARATSFRPAPRVEVYDAVCAEVGRRFYAPDFNGVDWPASCARNRPQAEAAASDGELLAVVRKMLSELRASHLEFFATPEDRPELLPARKGAEAETAGIVWRKLSPEVGYIKVESFEDGPQVVARVDRAFGELGNLHSLVIDLRGNGGGTPAAAMRIGDYLFDSARPVGYFASRAGLARRGVDSIDRLDARSLPTFDGYDSASLYREMEKSGAVMLVTGGRAPKHYAGRVAVLIDEFCFSAAEAFAGVVKETRAAALVGRRTAGAMLGADSVSLAGGWTIVLPTWDFRTPRGLRVEGRGVEPDIAVKPGRGKDPELAAALEFLKSPPPGAAAKSSAGEVAGR